MSESSARVEAIEARADFADEKPDLLDGLPRHVDNWRKAVKHVADHFNVTSLRDAVAVDYTLRAADAIPRLLDDNARLRAHAAAMETERDALIEQREFEHRWGCRVSAELADTQAREAESRKEIEDLPIFFADAPKTSNRAWINRDEVMTALRPPTDRATALRQSGESPETPPTEK